jgi:hypothetical protein
MTREFTKTEREAEITDVLREVGGPVRVRGICAMLAPDDKVPSRSLIARVTQSLRVMEREGIVKRGTGQHGWTDWRLA